jgi:hypothetical protein
VEYSIPYLYTFTQKISKETMFVDKLSGMPPFLGIGALGVVNVVAMRLWRHARTTEELGEGASSYCVIRTSDPRCCARSAGC